MKKFPRVFEEENDTSDANENQKTETHPLLPAVVVRIIYCLMIPAAIIGSILLLLPALVWWICTGKNLMNEYDKTFSQWNKCNLVLWDLKDILCRMGENLD